MKFQDTLNTKLWDLETNDLQPEVKSKLEEIADAFIEYIEIPQDAILDMVITGSSASYNYNEHSDLDLHIIVDYDKIHDDCPLVEGYLGALKNTFNKEHDIFIHGVPVELYAEQKDQGTVHNGLYSLNTGWIDEPQKIPPTDNDAAVEAKYQEIKDMVDKCNDSEEATELLEKIYDMRKAGLAEAGEFCTENLAFKKLRNEGCMDKLRQIKKEKIDKQLSLESYNESEDIHTLTDEDKEYLRNRLSKDYTKEGVEGQIHDVERMLKDYIWTTWDSSLRKERMSSLEEVLSQYSRKRVLWYIVRNNWGGGNTLGKSLNTFKIYSPNTYLGDVEGWVDPNPYKEGDRVELLPIDFNNRKYGTIIKMIDKDNAEVKLDSGETVNYSIKNLGKNDVSEIKNESIKEDHTFIDEYEVSETRGDWIITKDFNYNFASYVAAISNKYDLNVYLSYYDHELIKDYKGKETYNDIKWDDEVPNLLSVEDALYYIGLPNSFPTEEFKKAVVDINDDIKANYDAYWDTYHERHGLPKPNKNESIKEDYEDADYGDDPEEMHKERYAVYFETQEGKQKYTVYHVYTDSTDDSYNELCDKRDNQLGMYNSYKELKDALKERAEKIAKQQGWTVKSIDNLGEDDEYYRERNKWESIKETQDKFNKNESLNEEDDKFNYMMLGRLKQDCEYFLGNGNGHEKHLWAGNVEDQIGEMRKIYDKLPEKPEWLSLKDIDKYEKDMLEKRDSKNESFTDIHKELNKYMNESKENMLKTIADEVYAEIQKLYDNDKDLMEYVVVDYDIRKYNDGSNMYVIEVRNELSYEGMVSLAEKLDKVVQKYDKTAYFDQVDGGIMDAVLDLDNNQTNTDMSFVEIKESLDKYNNYFQLEETKGSYRSFIKKYIDEHPECKDKKANKVYFDIAKEWDKQEPKPEHSLHVFKDTAIDYIKSFLRDTKKNENLDLTLTCLNKQLDKFLS